MKVPFLDLRLSKTDRDIYKKALDNVMKHGIFVMGPEIKKFEKKISNYCNRKYCVSVGSGTEALYLAIKALDFNVGDEIITTSLSWIATANAISLNNLNPVFADIEDNLNISSESVEKLISKKTKAVLVVNYTGKICNFDKIKKICKKNNLILIEDCAQSFGSSFKRHISGSNGLISTFSFNPMKPLAGLGECGAVLTNNTSIHKKLNYLRYNGTVNREQLLEPSLNCRMDTIQASFLLERLKNYKEIFKTRNRNAKIYSNELKNFVITPNLAVGEKHSFYTYTILCNKRDDLKKYLETKNIETKIQHPILMPLQKPYLKFKRDIKNANKIVKQILCLPVNEKVNYNQIMYVINNIKKFYNSKT